MKDTHLFSSLMTALNRHGLEYEDLWCQTTMEQHSSVDIAKDATQDFIDNNKDQIVIHTYHHMEYESPLLSSDMNKKDFDFFLAHHLAHSLTHIINSFFLLAKYADEEKFLNRFKFPFLSLESFYECSYCGERLFFEIQDEFNYHIKPCTFAKGKALTNSTPCIKKHNYLDRQTIQLPIPSGKMVIANDMRSLFKEEEVNFESKKTFTSLIEDPVVASLIEHKGYPSINNAVGLYHNMCFWASHDLAYIQVGNTMPSIMVEKNRKQIVLRHFSTYEDEIEEGVIEAEYQSLGLSFTNEKEEGSIITGLWAVMAMDYDAFSHRCNIMDTDVEKALSSLKASVIEVDKGHYDFTCLLYDSSIKSEEIYGFIKKA